MSNMKDFVIENGVLEYYEGDATEVIIPEGTTSIGNNAFDSCKSIVSVTIPNSVTSIGDEAFVECENLKKVTIPASVTSIGKGVFDGCKSLISVAIPDGVKSIEEGLFFKCESITEVIIPDSVTYIGELAFYWCSSLREIEIPKSVKNIGKGAFQACISLGDVVIPDSVVSIEDRAFYDCETLGDVSIPDSVISIGADVFECSEAIMGPGFNYLYSATLTIQTSAGSVAEEYAKKNYIPCIRKAKDEDSLDRFLDAQEFMYRTALQEMKHGQKISHWIWYIFPQLRGLGKSQKAITYGISGLEEAKDYLKHPVLSARLIEISETLLAYKGVEIESIMGDIDALKLCSSMTLFAAVSEKNSVFHQVLDCFYGGAMDEYTIKLLKR